MSRRKPPPPPAAAIWWPRDGTTCYVGAGNDGLEFQRHTFSCKPGMWSVAVTGWNMRADAVVDNFGNLVQVRT